MRKPSSVPMFIVALVALVVVGYANHAAFRSGDHPEAEQARQAELASDQATKPKSAASLPNHSASNPTIPSTDIAPISELTVGNSATAQTKITYGYSIDEQVEANPATLNDFIAALRQYAQSKPSTSLKVVCLDIPSSDLNDKSDAAIAPGLSKNGKLVMALSDTLRPPLTPFDASQFVKMMG